MVHNKRLFSVKPITDPAELAAKLTGTTWTLCTGFKHADHYFLNDSFSENGAQEYAIFRETANPKILQQIESITFSWCSTEEAEDFIKEIAAGKYDHDNYGSIETIQIEQHKPCYLCE